MDRPVPEAYEGRVRADLLWGERSVDRTDRSISVDRRHEPVTSRQEQLAHLGYVEMVEGGEE